MEGIESAPLGLQFVFLFILIILNAFFSASEMALVSVNRSKVEQKAAEGDKRYQKLLKVMKDPNNFLSTIQVGITLLTLLQGSSLADSLGEYIAKFMGGSEVAETVGSIISLILLTYLSIVFGELYPKRVALNLKDRWAIMATPIISFLGKIVSPFVWLLSASTNLLSRITPMKVDDADEKMTRDEIEYILTSNDAGLNNEERDMLQGVFSLDEIMAREVMVPRTDAFMVDINDDPKKIVQDILDHHYSRIPVYNEDKDKVIGLLHTKRLLAEAFENGFDNLNLQNILQKPFVVPETIFIDELLKQLQSSNNQMAILVDEYGGVSGLVTVEDLLEEIVGEIDDESDPAQHNVQKVSDNQFIVEGSMSLNDFNDYFKTNLDSDDVDTIAGYYLVGIGHLPVDGVEESYQVIDGEQKITLTNSVVKNSRIAELKVLFEENK